MKIVVSFSMHLATFVNTGKLSDKCFQRLANACPGQFCYPGSSPWIKPAEEIYYHSVTQQKTESWKFRERKKYTQKGQIEFLIAIRDSPVLTDTEKVSLIAWTLSRILSTVP